MISPTKLLIKSINLQPEGTEQAKDSGHCVMCGGEFKVGDLVSKFSPAKSFTEFGDLKNPAGTHICGACKATWRKEFMQTYTKSVVSNEGVFPFFSNEAVTYWLLNPPQTPFLMFISTQQLGHIVWKAPVNYSRKVYFIRYNDKVLKVRREHLLKAINACKLLSDLMIRHEQENKKSRKVREFINPMVLDRSLERVGHGVIRDDARELSKGNAEAEAAIEMLESCTVGETWALAHALYAPNPAKPEARLVAGQLL